MSIQLKHTVIATGVLLSTLAFSAPAFSLDESAISESLDRLSSLKAKLGKGDYNSEMRSKGMLKRIDTNDDRMVSSAEYMNYFGEIFDALDADSDNSLDKKEWAGSKANINLRIATERYSRELRKRSTMEMMDTDEDHNVSRDEFVDFQQAIFEEMDKKGNGNIRY